MLGTLSPVDPRAVYRKIFWRIVPLLFVLYIVAYLDRANVSFAKLDMEKKLPFLSAEVYGWGVALFYVGYLLLEIPGALIVEHWSARLWFARILVTWGLCSMGMALVTTEWQFYLARFLLGLAEAGFYPGVIVYLTHWFPRAERGRALAGLILAVPLSQAAGAWVTSLILEVRGLGFDGWQWVFLLEGAPAVLLGVAVLFLLADRPRHATWLTPAERDWLEATLQAERDRSNLGAAVPVQAAVPATAPVTDAARPSGGITSVPTAAVPGSAPGAIAPSDAAAPAASMTVAQALAMPTVWLLALGIFATNLGGYGLIFWLPTTIKNLLLQLDRPAETTNVLAWSAICWAFGMAGAWLAGYSSDRTGERKWHCIAGQVLTGVMLVLSSLPGLSWPLVFFALCGACFFAFVWPPPFWVLPTQVLSASAAAVAVGIINIAANVAGIVSPIVVAALRKAEFDEQTCLQVLAACYVLGGVCIACLSLPASAPRISRT